MTTTTKRQRRPLSNIATDSLRLELLSRYTGPQLTSAIRIGTPLAIFNHVQPLFVGLTVEQFHVLTLNPANGLLGHHVVAYGSVDQCHVDPREVFSAAIKDRASALVLVHNHPSGTPEPSAQDVALTRQLKEGARLLCVKLVDHVVVGAGAYVSMLARGLL